MFFVVENVGINKTCLLTNVFDNRTHVLLNNFLFIKTFVTGWRFAVDKNVYW